MTARAAGERGFTLLEVAVATALLGVVASILFGVLTRAKALEAETVFRADLAVRARIALDRIVRELCDSGPSTFSVQPLAPLGASGLTYRRARGWTGTAIVWSAPYRVEWRIAPGEAENGVDDDGDGLADEGRAVWIEDPGGPAERVVTLCENVSAIAEGESANALDDNGNLLIDERGLSFELASPDIVTVRITVAGRGPGGSVMQVSKESAVLVRNP